MVIQRQLKTINKEVIDISDFEVKKSIKIAEKHMFKNVQIKYIGNFNVNNFSLYECDKCKIICIKDLINNYYFYEDNILFMTCDEFIIKSIVE